MIIRTGSTLLRLTIIAAAILALVTSWYFIRWHFADAIAATFEKGRPESKIIFEGLVGLGPDDPTTHFGRAVTLEKTFEPGDLEQSLKEYELAVAASPYDYRLWLALARARQNVGDSTGAEAAFKRAQELAPNYSAVAWAYGNFLIRQGDTEKGFPLISQAASVDPQYASPAASLALQVFDGDASRVRTAMGDKEPINAALAGTFAAMGRYQDAADSWSKLPADARPGIYKDLGQKLVDQMALAKRFRMAALVAGDLQPDNALKPVIGQVNNGSFENGIKLRQAGAFEWKVGEGGQPQIALTTSQKHSGGQALSLVFNSFEAADFRDVSQLIAVEPGAVYELQLFYRSDLNTKATLRWQVVDAAAMTPIASAPPLALVGDWTRSGISFTVPAGVDGIVIRLVHEGCTGPACPITGKLVVDDVSLRRS